MLPGFDSISLCYSDGSFSHSSGSSLSYSVMFGMRRPISVDGTNQVSFLFSRKVIRVTVETKGIPLSRSFLSSYPWSLNTRCLPFRKNKPVKGKQVFALDAVVWIKY